MYMGGRAGMKEQIVWFYGKFKCKYDIHLSIYFFGTISKHTPIIISWAIMSVCILHVCIFNANLCLVLLGNREKKTMFFRRLVYFLSGKSFLIARKCYLQHLEDIDESMSAVSPIFILPVAISNEVNLPKPEYIGRLDLLSQWSKLRTKLQLQVR